MSPAAKLLAAAGLSFMALVGHRIATAPSDDVAMQQKNNVIQEQRRLLAERETELIEKAEFEKKSVRLQIENMKSRQDKKAERDKYINERINHINLYVKNFINVYERKPLRDEIVDNLNNEVEKDVFDIFFASYNSLDSA